MAPLKNTILRVFRSRFMPTALLFFLAFALRAYKLSAPLWLDEIVVYRLRNLGVRAALQNSMLTEHPPLYYFIMWAGACLGSANSEISWRWLSVVWGICAVVILWRISLEFSDHPSSFLVTVLLATSPILVFYSQEARSYAFEFFLASISIWIIVRLIKSPDSLSLWLAWSLVSLLGLHSGYGYAMVAGTQGLFLGFHYFRQPNLRKSALIIIIGVIPLLPCAYAGLHKEAVKQLSATPLNAWWVFQTLLAGEQSWYGSSFAHIGFPLIGFGLAGIGIFQGIRSKSRLAAYLIFQVILPLILFFGLIPLFGIHLALKNARIFIVILPAFYLLIGSGLSEITRWCRGLGKWAIAPASAITLILLIFNINGLQSYYSIPKSPSSLAVISLAEKIQPGERAVSLHQRLNYSFDFYTKGIKVYLNPLPGVKNTTVMRYQLIESQLIFEQEGLAKHNQSVEDIRRNKKFWVLFGSNTPYDLVQQIVSACAVLEQERFEGLHEWFEVRLVKCP